MWLWADLLQRCRFVACHQATHDDVLQQDDLEWREDGTAVQH